MCNVVNLPVDALSAPIAVPSIAPPLISTLLEVNVSPAVTVNPALAVNKPALETVKPAVPSFFSTLKIFAVWLDAPFTFNVTSELVSPVIVVFAFTINWSFAVNVVNLPVDALSAPITVPSISPLLISTLVIFLLLKSKVGLLPPKVSVSALCVNVILLLLNLIAWPVSIYKSLFIEISPSISNFLVGLVTPIPTLPATKTSSLKEASSCTNNLPFKERSSVTIKV